MVTDRANDVLAFKTFIDEQLMRETVPTVDDVIIRWEFENESHEERAATVEAVREALVDMHAGDTGIPAREAIAQLRRKHNLPELS
jgi:hypothetical protein